MKNYMGVQFYNLDRFYRDQLNSFERDRIIKSVNEEEYFTQRMRKFGIKIITEDKDTRSNDDGIDFVIEYKEIIFICQLKYWGKPLGKKLIKAIFGEMFLSDISIKYREKEKNIRYLLICPFINNKNISSINKYSKEKFYVIHGEAFVELLNNPMYFIEKKIYEKEEQYGEYQN